MSVPENVLERLLGWHRIVVLTHTTPDADALAAMLALAAGFQEPGRRDVCASLPEGSVSKRLTPLVALAEPFQRADARAFADAQGFVAVDTAKASRCNVGTSIPETWADAKPVINIDHHASNTRFGEINWVDEHAGSSSELVYELLRAARRPLSPPIASLLYAGILTDTVGFTVSSTSAQSLRIAADLVDAGADVSRIGELMYRSLGAGEFQLLRTLYANTHFVADNRIAYSTASHDEIVSVGCSAADIDEQVNVPRCLAGIQIAMLLTEGNRGKTRINFRGESGFPVLDLARSFGGGGHAEAAGAILDMPLDQALPLVLAMATECVEKCSRRENG